MNLKTKKEENPTEEQKTQSNILSQYTFVIVGYVTLKNTTGI